MLIQDNLCSSNLECIHSYPKTKMSLCSQYETLETPVFSMLAVTVNNIYSSFSSKLGFIAYFVVLCIMDTIQYRNN